MMAIALRMARRGLGTTRPNPSVGAVIADESTGELLARAVTAPGGRPHAETLALGAAGARARGATMYVTLEPCSHHGHTGPCADAIIAADLKRVVCAIEDPDPRVAGRGLDRLRAAGVDVRRGVGGREARWITRGHIVRVTERRPFVTIKMALDANGEIARGDGHAAWVTGALARAHGHLLRAQADAILVGSGTVRDDDPELTCRLPGLLNRSPVRVVLSRDLDVPLNRKLFQTAETPPTWIVARNGVSAARRAAFEALGVDVIEAATVQDRLWLPSVMEALVARGVTRLLVEGGPSVWRAFTKAGLYDEVALFMAGDGDLDSEIALTQRLGSAPLTLVDQLQLEGDRLWRYRRRSPNEGA
ncbi:MAG: bifunctional diaminohydroxyphosphoribosylaminopyrimidine deaminase/5-amino-6-(5-phosphoribosylamino)uracil reductase RibD [Hyphomicrobium sp.]